MNCIIITGGSNVSTKTIRESLKNCDFIICADSGYDYIKNTDIKPDIILGDFDSISDEKSIYNLEDTAVKKYPCEKDKTDTELAIELALERGFKSIKILGGYGSRADHTLANLMIVSKYSKIGLDITLKNDNNDVYYIKHSIEIKNSMQKYISIIPVIEEVVLSCQNLKYPLENTVIRCGSSLGVSNEIIKYPLKIDIIRGETFVILSDD